jgi:integration host factor subunit alpha|tara:strand:+ start:1976 stop:2251 length:276 start_codon:yes stop_codon:yes gene_type:complete
MNFSKKDIIKKITKKSSIPFLDGSMILESFLVLIKNKSHSRSVKLSGFGSFIFKKTPKRIGRNPKTKVSYIIDEMSKLNFKPSNKIKGKLN